MDLPTLDITEARSGRSSVMMLVVCNELSTAYSQLIPKFFHRSVFHVKHCFLLDRVSRETIRLTLVNL